MNNRQPEGPSLAGATGVGSPSPAHGARAWAWAAMGALALGAIVWFVYRGAIDTPLIFDDIATVEENTSIVKLWPLVDDSEEGAPLTPQEGFALSGRPVVNLSMAVNYYFNQLDPRGYHIGNIGLHILCALLMWTIVRRTLLLDYFHETFARLAGPLAFAAALLWALHPLNSECVVYITQRTEVLTSLFYLATLYGCLRYWEAASRPARAGWLVLSALACVLGMLSKEMMASVPAMALLYERTFIAGSFRQALRRSWPLYVALALGWVPLLALNLDGVRTPLAGFNEGVDAYPYWLTEAKILLLYMKLAFWPWPLVIHYEIPYMETIGEAWPYVLPVALLGVATVWLVLRRSALGFVMTWIVAILSPTLLVPMVTEAIVERRMYLPLAAMVPLVVAACYLSVRRLLEPAASRARGSVPSRASVAVCASAVVALAVVYSLLTERRIEDYHDELSIWRDAEAKQPAGALTQINIGIALGKAGRNDEALMHFLEGVKLDPNSFHAHYNLARALDEAGRSTEAIDHYLETLRLKPRFAPAHNNVGMLLANLGKTQQAIGHYEEAIRIKKDFAAAHNNLGVLLAGTGHPQEAIVHLERALSVRPDFETYFNLAIVYSLVDRSDDAIATAEKALQMARAQNQTVLADHIDNWLTTYRNSVLPQ